MYLEAGAIPIRFIISSRRLIYHQTILKREDSELTKRIYIEQKQNPTKGDYVELLREDFKIIDEAQDDEKIKNISIIKYKAYIKSKIKLAAFKYLMRKLKTHSKVSHIEYQKLETQGYMTSPVFTNVEVNMLHSLRARCADVKMNFKHKYIQTHTRCSICDIENEDQQHILLCEVIQQYHKSENITQNTVKYEDLFSKNIHKQKEITALYVDLFDIKRKLLNKCQEAPSSSNLELTMGRDVLQGIDFSLSGNLNK